MLHCLVRHVVTEASKDRRDSTSGSNSLQLFLLECLTLARKGYNLSKIGGGSIYPLIRHNTAGH